MLSLYLQPTATNDCLGQASEALRRYLVAHGGEMGGWDAKDHALFLQWRSRFQNNRQTFVSAVCDTVPGSFYFIHNNDVAITFWAISNAKRGKDIVWHKARSISETRNPVPKSSWVPAKTF